MSNRPDRHRKREWKRNGVPFYIASRSWCLKKEQEATKEANNKQGVRFRKTGSRRKKNEVDAAEERKRERDEAKSHGPVMWSFSTHSG